MSDIVAFLVPAKTKQIAVQSLVILDSIVKFNLAAFDWRSTAI